jgi:hypothetical protein
MKWKVLISIPLKTTSMTEFETIQNEWKTFVIELLTNTMIYLLVTTPDFVNDNTYYTEDVVKDAIKTMIVGNGTPIFVIVRNGKLVTVDNGFSGTNSLDSVYTLVNETLKADFENTLITDSVNKVWTAVTGDSVTTNKFNYDNVNLYQYLK